MKINGIASGLFGSELSVSPVCVIAFAFTLVWLTLWSVPTVCAVQNRKVLTDQTNQQEKYIVDREGIRILNPNRPAQPNGKLGFAVLKGLCDLGSRTSGSEGMLIQQKMLTEYFTGLGATVTEQKFNAIHPEYRHQVEMKNLIVGWHPERRYRVLICCHYDTLPFPNQDKNNPRGLFVGANDGASGVGMLCELGRYMADLDSDFGVDFVFFDGEEFVYQRPRDPLFLGSTHFANQYVRNRPPVLYSGGVLVDMIGDKDLKLYFEKNSYRMAREMCRQIWTVAEDLDIKEFIPKTRFEISDDHLPLNQIAGIMTCDIIDFDYPKGRRNLYWHTEQDTPDKCSAESLSKVAVVLLAWLRKIKGQR